MKLALVGLGKMGQMIESLAPEYGFDVVSKIDVGDDLAQVAHADVAIEFTQPESAPKNLKSLANLGVPVVCGTTGWYEHLEDVSNAFQEQQGSFVYGSNFSIGVAVFRNLVKEAAARFASLTDYEALAYEAHHSAKKDAPSGTLKTLIEDMRSAGYQSPIDEGWNRAGKIPGTHEISFDSAADTVTLRHVARSREGFARGALYAAKWIVGNPGIYEFSQTLETKGKE